MDQFPDGLSIGGDHLVIVLDLLALIDELVGRGLAAFIDDHRGDFEDGLGIEIILRIGHGHLDIDIAADGFHHLGRTLNLDVLGHLGHFFHGCAGHGTCHGRQRGKNAECFLHMV